MAHFIPFLSFMVLGLHLMPSLSHRPSLLTHVNRTEPLLMVLVTPVLFPSMRSQIIWCLVSTVPDLFKSLNK